ncbi:MAG TPA: O-antigen ligase family protein [Solirubrobacteraceae bacterium]
MSRSLAASFRESPAVLPALAAVALFVVWAGDQAGYPLTHWAPGGLIVLAALAIALANIPVNLSLVPVPVRVALACLAGYTALSYCSILWAKVPADAWEGSNRTLLYLLVFCLFSLWRGRGRSAALLLGAWTLGLIALAVFVAVHIDSASGGLRESLPGGRLSYPSGYPNANAAQWLMAFWPALFLARSERLPWALRGFFGAGAVVLCDLALLSQSRGSVYAMAVMLVLVFVSIPGRLRTFAVLVPVLAGIGLSTQALLAVGDHLRHGQVVPSTLHTGIEVMFLAALLVGLAVALAAAIESKHQFSAPVRVRIRRGLGLTAVTVLVAIVGGGLLAAGNAVTRVRHGWESFKGGYGTGSATSSRLVSGLGSNRYDFYRVALDEFVAHPLLGIGADNFAQQYLRHGRSDETPHYPHSVELRTLSQTGLLGAILALLGLGGALLAGARSLKSPDPLVRAVAAGALGGFAYWMVHGSFDWFWEMAGLGAPAFALLGIAGGLSSSTGKWSFRQRRAIPRRFTVGALALIGLAAGLSLAAPWFSQTQIQSAARIWVDQPRRAYALLNGAARLDPLSQEPYLIAGSIAVRFGDLPLADHEFSLALARAPENAYATLERGAIASATGRSAEALVLLARADALNPRDPLTQAALRRARRGERVSVQELNRSILSNAQKLV